MLDALIVKSQCSVFNNITTCKATSTVPGMFFATGPYAILRLFSIALGSSRTPVTSVESFINRPLSFTAACISLFLDLGNTTRGLTVGTLRQITLCSGFQVCHIIDDTVLYHLWSHRAAHAYQLFYCMNFGLH